MKMSKFSDYFDDGFRDLEPKPIEINELFGDKMYLISGDFYGIQKFIFDNLSTKNAAKVLRAKSAFCEIFMIVLARFICHKLGIDTKQILSCTAGKFEILTPKFDEKIFDEIKSIINSYFISNFYGISGVSLAFIKCHKDDFANPQNYKILRENISKAVEIQKFNKLNLTKQSVILNYDKTITNQTLCRICNTRKIVNSDKCDICERFVRLGEILVSDSKSIDSREIGIDFYDTKIELNEGLKSYVAKEKYEITDFSTLARLSSGENAIAVLKADVDNMGNFIKESDVTDSFLNFDIFSKSINNFFSLYIPQKMREKFPHSYTIFAGGDDLLLVGSYDMMIKLGIFIRQEFLKFVKYKNLTISFGITLAKPSIPISYLAQTSENLLESSKDLDGKDGISIFGESAKWDKYLKTRQNILTHFEDFTTSINTAFLYRILEFCQMSKNIKNDVKNSMWKSKLNYSFYRNFQKADTKKGQELLLMLNDEIKHNPKETKMVICEYIYKRRER